MYQPINKEDYENFLEFNDPADLRCVDSITINNKNYTELTDEAITQFILFKEAILNLSSITGE